MQKMANLRTVRDQAEAQYRAEAQLSQAMTVIESLQIWARLQMAFEWQLQQTAILFAEDHRESLVELQTRLHKLIE